MVEVLFTFDPATEFQVLETIDFEEEVQRPEELRFFTLDEQLLDYFEKILPKDKKATRFELKKLQTEVDRFRQIYTKNVIITDSEYLVDLSRKDVHVDWVKPVYGDFSYTAYPFAEKWVPLYERSQRMIPNGYPRRLMAMPKPFQPSGTDGVLLTKDQTLVSSEGDKAIHALGQYERSKTVIHDDGSMSIVSLPIANTGDDIRVVGYHMFTRPVDIPNPLMDHPFLASNQPSTITTDESLNDVFPSIDAILTHGVPTTKDPYGEGLKFLKVYDVKLSQIPWSVWKEKFPPVETINASPAVESISFPGDTNDPKPGDVLQKTYQIPFQIGYSPRHWLMMQEDAGAFVPKILLSKAGSNGLLTIPPPLEQGPPTLPDSTPEECQTLDGSFDAFLNGGLYRYKHWDMKSPPKAGVCVPVAFIQRERQILSTTNRLPWKETTETDILRDHMETLKKFQNIPEEEKRDVYQTFERKKDSERRHEVVIMLEDPHRDPEDKADAIELMTKDLQRVSNVFLDAEGGFVACAHTLAQLRGAMEEDRLGFYETWTGIVEGGRVCKYCGEQVNADVFVQQDDFDDEGRAILSHDVLPEMMFHGETQVDAFTNSLIGMKRIFDLDNAGEAVLYLLLSLFQVLPDEGQLLPVLQNIREVSMALRGRAAATKRIAKADQERIEGLLGVVGMLVLLQAHNPFLIPRRSFGKTLKLNGFPRDTEDPQDAPALLTIINVLKSTFESFPSTVKGPTAPLFREIIRASKKVKDESIVYVKQAYAKFRTQFDSAKARYDVTDEQLIENSIQLRPFKLEKFVFSPDENIGAEEGMPDCIVPRPTTILETRLPPNVRQTELPLRSGIVASSNAVKVDRIVESIKLVKLDDASIRKRLSLGVPKGLGIPAIDSFMKQDTDGNAYGMLLQRILDLVNLPSTSEMRDVIVKLDTHISASLYRDIMRGLVYETLHAIMGNTNKEGMIQTLKGAVRSDIVMRMLLITRDEAEKENNNLRARERDTLKQRLRNMNDTEREVTKQLLDIGIAPYIITNEDRLLFAREYNIPDELEPLDTDNQDIPEEGINDVGLDNDYVPTTVDGVERELDSGDYGSHPTRPYDDYGRVPDFDQDDGI